MPFLAIAMTVALPDICVSLKSPTGDATANGYMAWCDENLGPEFAYVTGRDLWSIRCGVLHQGRFGDRKKRSEVSRVIFAVPGDHVWTNCTLNGAYFYSVSEFCKNFTQAVARWLENNRNDSTVASNLPKLMQYRVGGFPPYYVGQGTVLA